MEAEGGEGDDHGAEDGQGQHLGPEDVEARALEEDAADNLHEIAHRVQVGQILDDHGHVANGKGKAAQHEGRHKEEEASHHGLLLGLRDGGKEQPHAQGGQQKKKSAGQQHQGTAAEWNSKDQESRTGDETQIQQPNDGEGKRLSQDQLNGTDGGDHQLLHGADFLLPDDGHGGQHDRDQGDDVHDHAGHKIVLTLEVFVEPDAALDGDRRCGALRLDSSCVASDHLSGIVGDNGGRVGVGAVNQDLDLGAVAAADLPSESRQDAHHGVNLAPVEQFLNGVFLFEVMGDVKIAGSLKLGQELPALRRPVLIQKGQRAVLDVQVDGVPEDDQLNQGRGKEDETHLGFPERLADFLEEDFDDSLPAFFHYIAPSGLNRFLFSTLVASGRPLAERPLQWGCQSIELGARLCAPTYPQRLG